MISLAGADAGETIEDILKAEGIDQAFEGLFSITGEMGYDRGSHSNVLSIAVVRGRNSDCPSPAASLFIRASALSGCLFES
jgi:hypothetical protein